MLFLKFKFLKIYLKIKLSEFYNYSKYYIFKEFLFLNTKLEES